VLIFLKILFSEQRQDIVELLFNNVEVRQCLFEQLKRVPDLEKLGKRIRGNKSSLKDTVGLYFFSLRLSLIVEPLLTCEDRHSDVLHEKFSKPLNLSMESFSKFEELVELTVDLKAVDNHEYVIKPEFAPQLKELAASKCKLEEQIEKLREGVLFHPFVFVLCLFKPRLLMT
jgi:DNA mismatch repair protein MSH2